MVVNWYNYGFFLPRSGDEAPKKLWLSSHPQKLDGKEPQKLHGFAPAGGISWSSSLHGIFFYSRIYL